MSALFCHYTFPSFAPTILALQCVYTPHTLLQLLGDLTPSKCLENGCKSRQKARAHYLYLLFYKHMLNNKVVLPGFQEMCSAGLTAVFCIWKCLYTVFGVVISQEQSLMSTLWWLH